MKGKMFPTIDKKRTGIHLRRIMDERGLSVKDIQQYLGLGSVQSIYHWLNGLSMPTIDNLYALSELFQMPVDDMLCGNRQSVPTVRYDPQFERMQAYYEKIHAHKAA
jgi:transcriptional regulator with XRE-family HTH domain